MVRRTGGSSLASASLRLAALNNHAVDSSVWPGTRRGGAESLRWGLSAGSRQQGARSYNRRVAERVVERDRRTDLRDGLPVALGELGRSDARQAPNPRRRSAISILCWRLVVANVAVSGVEGIDRSKETWPTAPPVPERGPPWTGRVSGRRLPHEPPCASARCRRASVSPLPVSLNTCRQIAPRRSSPVHALVTIVQCANPPPAKRPKITRVGCTMQAAYGEAINSGRLRGPAPTNAAAQKPRGSMPRWMVRAVALLGSSLRSEMHGRVAPRSVAGRRPTKQEPARERSTVRMMPHRSGGRMRRATIGVGDARLRAALG